MHKLKKKLVYTVTSLGNSGGIERVLINKANWLVNNGDYDVYIITEDAKTPFFHVDPRIKILPLNINKKYSKFLIIRFFRLIFFSIRCGHKISRLLKDISPNVIISVNAQDWWILPFINRTSKKIYEFHWITSKITPHKNRWIENINRKIVNIIGNSYDSIILLTKRDKELNTNNWKNIKVIPNACNFTCDTPAKLINNRAIAVGNLFHVKGFCRLIDVWNIVHQRHPDWSLSIYGDGYLREELQAKINSLSLTNTVKLEGKVADIKKAYLEYSISLCSSYEESFSMVLLEAQACGLPVIAFDCPHGPSEIITNGVDGFLIPDNDIQEYADRICLLIEKEEIRKVMGRNALKNAKRYTEDKVMPQWVKVFDE